MPGDGPVDGLAPDDENLINPQDTAGGTDGVIELVAIHTRRSSERNSVYTLARSDGDSTPANGVT